MGELRQDLEKYHRALRLKSHCKDDHSKATVVASIGPFNDTSCLKDSQQLITAVLPWSHINAVSVSVHILLPLYYMLQDSQLSTLSNDINNVKIVPLGIV